MWSFLFQWTRWLETSTCLFFVFCLVLDFFSVLLRKQIGDLIWSSNIAYSCICLCHHVRFQGRWAGEFLLVAAGAGKQGESICWLITVERSTQKDTEVIMVQQIFLQNLLMYNKSRFLSNSRINLQLVKFVKIRFISTYSEGQSCMWPQYLSSGEMQWREMLERLTCLTFVGFAEFHGLLMLEEASRMLFRGWILPLSICSGRLRGQNPVLHGLRQAGSAVSAHSRRCLQSEHERDKRISQKQVSCKQSPERGAEQRAEGTCPPRGVIPASGGGLWAAGNTSALLCVVDTLLFTEPKALWAAWISEWCIQA